MKKIITLFISCFLLFTVSSRGQTYENSWINYGQQYYKIKVAQDGMYRVPFLSFVYSGVPISSWPISKIQIFYKGVEQYMYTYDSDNNGFIDKNNDYIEFYGQKNDGSFDKPMYKDSTWQPNQRLSLITDTAVYFITQGATAGKRYTLQGSPTDTTYKSFLSADYFIKESYMEDGNFYNVGGFYPNEDIDYANAEGWVGSPFNQGNTLTKPCPTQNMFQGGGPNVDVNLTMVGANNNLHQIKIDAPGINNLDAVFSGYQVRRYNFNVSTAAFTSSISNFNFTAIPNIDNTENKIAFVNLSVKYPHTMDMEGASVFKMYIPDASQPKARLDMTNFNGTYPILYDITNHKRITVNSARHVLVDNDGNANPKFCFLVDSAQVMSIGASMISRINYVSISVNSQFNDFRTNSNFVKDSAYIIITHSSLASTVNAATTGYRDYRNGTTNNKVAEFDVEEIYDQFGYGQKNCGLAIKNFVHFILDKWTAVHPPQAIFLIGKSIQPDMIRYNSGLWKQCLVASYGYPASDMRLVSGINGSIYDPVIPIGRLSAKNGTDITNYLEKVKEYELAQNGAPEEWMKEVLHFGGGANIYEQTTFKKYLNYLESIIEDSSYGGHVTSYFKSSSDPIQINQSDSLQAKINNGVSAMLFFGHASGSSFDVSTDLPQNYGNRGKYPIIIASSCFAGNVHNNPTQLSNCEQFVLEPRKAAIAFLASVGEGNAYYLNQYDTAFYNNISYRNYGAGIGKIIQATIRSLQSSPSATLNPEEIKQVVLEMSLQGDPVLKYNSWSKPDYVAEEKNIFFTPSFINTQTDTFSIHFITRNWAKAVPDSFNVSITRTLPDGSTASYIIPQSGCYYADTLSFTMKTGALNGAGVNKFNVRVDLDPNKVPETHDFTNNQASTSLFIYSSDISPIYPPKYAIHPYSTVTLKASTVNPLGPTRTYRFEIDTAYFNDSPSSKSPLFRFGNVTSSGGVISWSPPSYTLLDSTVYYWRVYDDTTTINKNESSFIYIKNKTGWAQSHFFQFKNDGYVNVLKDSLNRQFNYDINLKALSVLDYGYPANNAEAQSTGYYLNNDLQASSGGCGMFGVPFIHLAVIDSLTLTPWSNCNVNHGQTNTYTSINSDCSGGTGNCQNHPENYFTYLLNDPTQQQRLHQFVDSIADGHYLLIYSWLSGAYSLDTSLKNLFTDLGIDSIYPGQDNVPFIVFLQKGKPATVVHSIGTAINSVISLHATLSSIWYRGNIVSELAGPAAKWNSLHWKQHKVENGASKDSINLSVWGLNSSTNIYDTLINSQIFPSNYDTSLSWINSATYPYLKLNAYLQDDSLRTPPQMDKWQIYYDEVPECALNANRHYSFYKNPLAEGDTMRMSIAIDNISDLPMDSLGVSFYMYDKNRKRHDIKTYKLDSLRVGQTLNADLVIDTTFGYNGANSLWVEANPYITKYNQPEQYHFNNVAEVKFNISKDVINPILDVTFDGIHILDGDIVSGKPHITIQLHDENKYLALNDTSKFHVYLKSPSGQNQQQMNFFQMFYGSYLRFIPAVLPKNSCKIEYDPVLPEDGIYTLEVEAADRSDNESGKYNYRITFEVINKSTITEVLNYPNPFSTSTRFVFVLTGNEVPEHMKIRIMTVTGKIVREITKEELGNIHVGRNITDYAWDGRDSYGDQLANGVYLYRVDTDLKNGDRIEHRDSEADKYFKKEWGKMYLMR